jgi:hypothetical protein
MPHLPACATDTVDLKAKSGPKLKDFREYLANNQVRLGWLALLHFSRVA